MKDLLKSLVVGHDKTLQTQSSQDSFHSTEEQWTTQHSTAPDLTGSPTHKNLQVCDVDAYLADPKNAALLSSTAINAMEEKTTNHQSSKENQPIQPTQLSVQTSHYVSLLYQQCQAKGLTPIFEMEGEVGQVKFRGVLKIGDATITLDEDYRTKKEARERLAEKGLEVVKGMESRKRAGPTSGIEGGFEKEPNWIGMLQEYHNLEYGPSQSPIYTFYSLGQNYACTATIASNPDNPFGSPTQPFQSKKLAQRTAAAAAVQHLISEAKLSPSGKPLSRNKKPKHGSGNPSSIGNPSGSGSSISFNPTTNTLTIPPSSPTHSYTYAQKLHDLSVHLALQSPIYNLTPESMDAPNILSGYVTFPNSGSGLPPRLGEVRNVFGKKAAKEEVARGAWGVLVEVARGRGVRVEGGGERE